jgi:putative transposase
VAPTGLSGILVLEITPARSRTAFGSIGHQEPYQAHQPRQRPVGCAADPRRAAQAGHRDQSSGGFEVHNPPFQAFVADWCAFLRNHLECLASVDFFVAPTVTLRILFVFIVLQHQRRRIVHFGVTVSPTSQWTSQQIREAFPWDSAPRYLIRDRDDSYGAAFRSRLKAMDITEVLSAPRSPWQNAFAERVIGSIRRDCLNHVIVLSEHHLRRLLSSYLGYYHHSRTHLSLEKDCPEPRLVQPPDQGRIIAFPQVGGLHYRYERLAA